MITATILCIDMRSIDLRFILPIILAVLIGIIVSFAVLNYNFVNFSNLIWGDNQILFGL